MGVGGRAAVKISEAIEQARAAAEALRAEFPGIEDDLPLWEASIDSMTDAADLADWLVNRALDREQMARMAKERADALRERGERFKRAAESARTCALHIYEAAGIRKRETVEWTASVRLGTQKVIVTDANALESRFLRNREPEPDKTAIKAALEAGEFIDGAELSNAGPQLQIRTK
jgi:hypothetical protein